MDRGSFDQEGSTGAAQCHTASKSSGLIGGSMDVLAPGSSVSLLTSGRGQGKVFLINRYRGATASSG